MYLNTKYAIDNRSCFTILIIMFAFGEVQNSGEGYLEIFPEDVIDETCIYISLKSCDTCQRANDTNFSTLFSPVESKAWNQVELQSHIFCVCVMQPPI